MYLVPAVGRIRVAGPVPIPGAGLGPTPDRDLGVGRLVTGGGPPQGQSARWCSV